MEYCFIGNGAFCDLYRSSVIIDNDTKDWKVNLNFLEWVVLDNSLTLDHILAIPKALCLWDLFETEWNWNFVEGVLIEIGLILLLRDHW